MIQAPRPHRMMPVVRPQILQRIDADNARRAFRGKTAADSANIKAASGLYAPAPVHQVMHPKPAPFYVNVYQLTPGRNFLGAPSAGPIYSSHAIYRLRVTLKAKPVLKPVIG